MRAALFLSYHKWYKTERGPKQQLTQGASASDAASGVESALALGTAQHGRRSGQREPTRRQRRPRALRCASRSQRRIWKGSGLQP